MKFLLDTSAEKVSAKHHKYEIVGGQLLTPLTRYKSWRGTFAMDNGAFSGFKAREFRALLARESHRKRDCLFVAIPDVVGDARRTLEIWQHRHKWAVGWPLALVAQDGQENLAIPWDEIDALFLGGRDPWKDSPAAQNLVRTAKILGKHVHIGRVNTARRFALFSDLGADTCDGSGASKYDHMLDDIVEHMSTNPHPELQFNENQ